MSMWRDNPGIIREVPRYFVGLCKPFWIIPFLNGAFVGPLTESDHNSYGTDYVNVPSSRALKISNNNIETP